MEDHELRKATLSFVQLCTALASTVYECHKEGNVCPSGAAYAAFNAKGVDIEGYESIVRALENAKLIKRSNNCLVWIGGDL